MEDQFIDMYVVDSTSTIRFFEQFVVGFSKGLFQEESGGNWLVNTAPGLLFGGIQNSKDFPICPYLLSTVWQYGDSEVGGWVYDPSLQVITSQMPYSGDMIDYIVH